MLNLMVLHWGTVSQTITIDCTFSNGKFKSRSTRGAICAGQDFDTIPLYNSEVSQQVRVLN